MKKVLLFCLGLIVFSAFGCATYHMEVNTDRKGSDYKNFDLVLAEPAQCAFDCMADPQCKAWTYVRPGVQGKKARCWLKDSVPEPTKDSCCVSGVKKK